MPDRRPDSTQAGSPIGATHENQISPKQERGLLSDARDDCRDSHSVCPHRRSLKNIGRHLQLVPWRSGHCPWCVRTGGRAADDQPSGGHHPEAVLHLGGWRRFALGLLGSRIRCSRDGSCLLRFHFGPLGGREPLNLRYLGRGQAREQIFQMIEWIEAVPPTTAQQGINHGAALSSLRMSNEQPVLFSEGTGPDGIFDQVVVDLRQPDKPFRMLREAKHWKVRLRQRPLAMPLIEA